MPKLIGLSLSFCVTDILAGKVALEDVEKIISGTCMNTPQAYNTVKMVYSNIYWKDYPQEKIDEVWDAVYQLLEQPRLNGEEPPSILEGHWKTT